MGMMRGGWGGGGGGGVRVLNELGCRCNDFYELSVKRN